MNNKQNTPPYVQVFQDFGKKFQYFGDNSVLHGVGYVFSSARLLRIKRLFWFVMLATSALGAASVLLAVLRLYSAGSVSYSVDTSFLDWSTPFPAVTICEELDTYRLKDYLLTHKLPLTLTNFYKDINFWNNKFCKTCSNCEMNITCVEDYQQVVSNYRLKCIDLMKDCWWNNQHFHCCEEFKMVETEYGPCYTFNSRLFNNSGLKVVNRKTGVPTLTFTGLQVIKIRVHSPDDMISVASENILGAASLQPMVTEFKIIVKVEETVTDSSVLAIPASARGCLLPSERPSDAPLWPFKRYSYDACLLYCRAMEQVTLCNCTHHFITKMDTIQTCNLTGLACLHKHKDQLVNVICQCPMGCEELVYKLIHVFSTRYSVSKLPKEIVERGSLGQVRLALLPDVRVRRKAVRDMLSLVVDVGGVGGVFFGASVLGIIEIVYLFCIRRQKPNK